MTSASPDSSSPCKLCGVLVSCQGSDATYRYHDTENPRHVIIAALTPMSREARVDFLREIPFCPDCGDEDPDRNCLCMRDE